MVINSLSLIYFAAGFGPKLIEIIKHKLTYGSKILPLGRGGKIFEKSFSIKDGERLLHASRCYIYTTAGAISGILFISTERVGFCSDRSLKTYSTTGKLLKFQYKVSIPLKKIDGVGESTDLKRPSNKYMELVTVDDFNFWFLGFPNYKKTIEFLRQTLSHDCLSD
ncbi:putative GEM-like protein [Helianthus annuus]|nr:putative GEM-like protein [Helianthus annuus]KAJ0635393.1 putative GEM-like protein [Helianthus annuus]